MPFIPEYLKTRNTQGSGARADQPAATDLVNGTLYYVDDENVIERTDQTAWAQWGITYRSSGITILDAVDKIQSQPTGLTAPAGGSLWHALFRTTAGDAGGTSDISSFQSRLNVTGTSDVLVAYGSLNIADNQLSSGTITSHFGIDNACLVSGAGASTGCVPFQGRLAISGAGNVTNISFFRAQMTAPTSSGDVVGSIRGFYALNIGRASATTIAIVDVDDQTKGSSDLYAFRGSIASGTGRWNLYMSGTAQNHLRGNLGIGSGTTAPAVALEVVGRASISTTQGGLQLSNDTTSPNVVTLNAVNFSGATQGGFFSVNSRFSAAFPDWEQSSSSATTTAMFMRMANTLWEIRFGNAANSDGVDPGTMALRSSSTVLTVGSSHIVNWLSRARFTSPADSQILVTNDAANAFDRFMFGGTSSSFPAWKRSSTELQARLADDSADAPLKASQITTSSTDFIHETSAALADGAGAGAGTLTNAPTLGDPTKWVAINDNGTTRYIPTWT